MSSILPFLSIADPWVLPLILSPIMLHPTRAMPLNLCAVG